MVNLKVFQNTDLRLTNFTFQPLGEEMKMMLRFQGEGSFIAPYDA